MKVWTTRRWNGLLPHARWLAAALGLLLMGCTGGRLGVSFGPNAAPLVLDAYAGCFFDPALGADVWYFEALVDDPNGFGDIGAVEVDVYDELTGLRQATIELVPTATFGVWATERLARQVVLDCFYPGYTADVLAFDGFDAGVLTIPVDTAPLPAL